MRFKAFLSRYRVLAGHGQLRRCEEKAVEDCQTILQCLEGKQTPRGLVVTWAFGKRHIFLRFVLLLLFFCLFIDLMVFS